MDWPSVWDPANPGYERMWGMIGATFEKRGVVEGHGSGLIDPHDMSAFAAAGMSSDHEIWALRRSVGAAAAAAFHRAEAVLLRRHHARADRSGSTDWSNVAFTTDDRTASETLEKGASRLQRAPRDRVWAGSPKSPSSARRSIRRGTCGSTSGSARSRRGAMPTSCCSTTWRRSRSRTSMPTASWCRRARLYRPPAADRLAGLGDEDDEYRP